MAEGFDPDAFLAGTNAPSGFDPDAFLKSTEPPPSLAGDIGRSAVSGLGQGVVGLPGAPGSLISMGKDVGNWINRKLYSPEQIAAFEAKREKIAKTPPTSGEMIHAAENVTGEKFYEPQTGWGETARTIGEFAPNVLGGEGNIAANIAKRVVAPALFSEGAGQVTKGTAAEPYARALAPLLTEVPRAARDIKGAVTEPPVVGPTEAAQKQFAGRLYDRARNLGVEFKPKPIENLSNKIISDLEAKGFRRLDAPSTWSKIEELKNPAGKNPTIDDLESVRKALGKVPSTPTEIGTAMRAKRAIDDYLANINNYPGHIAVNPHYAGSLSNIMKDARAEYAAMERGNTIEGALKQAVFNSGVSGNLDTKLRQQIKQILSKAVLKKRGGFNDDEIAAMGAIVGGSDATNAARVAGSVAPHGAVRVAAAHAIGSIFPHPLAATTLISALGKVSKSFGDRQTQRKVEQLIQQVRSRSPLGTTIPQPGRPPVSFGPYVGTGLLGQSSAQEQGHAYGGRIRRAEGGHLNLDESLQGEIEDRRNEVPDFAQKPFTEYHPFHYSDAGEGTSVSSEMPYWHENKYTGKIERIRRTDGGSADAISQDQNQDQALASSMTHWPEAPNPVPGIVKPIADYLRSGDYNPVHLPGTQPKDYLRELAHNPDILAKNIEQASGFGGMAGTLKPIKGTGVRLGMPESSELQGAANLNKTPTEQFIDEYDALVRKKAAELNREDFRIVEPPNILPRNLGPVRPNRPINEQTLAEMRELQAQIDKQGIQPPGRPINEQTLAEMRTAEGRGNEKVQSAAIRTPQGVFGGANHAEIIDRLARQYGDDIYKNIEDGFITSSGRFVDRAEANKIALKQNQHRRPNVIPDLFGAEDLQPPGKRARGGRIIGAKSQSEVGLAQNEAGTTFRCGTCKYFKKGECWNENPELHGRKVKPHWCCNLYDHAGMKVIA